MGKTGYIISAISLFFKQLDQQQQRVVACVLEAVHVAVPDVPQHLLRLIGPLQLAFPCVTFQRLTVITCWYYYFRGSSA